MEQSICPKSVYLVRSSGDLQEQFDLELCFGLEDNVHVVAGGDDRLWPGVVADVHGGDKAGVGIAAVTDLQGGPFVQGGSHVHKVECQQVAVLLGVKSLPAFPANKG